MKHVIAENHLQALREIQQKQRSNALALGMLEWEVQRARDGLAVSEKDPESMTRLGTLEWEYMCKREFFFAAIRRAEQEQRFEGDAALRVLGLPGEEQHTISLQDGTVSRFISGDNPRWTDDF